MNFSISAKQKTTEQELISLIGGLFTHYALLKFIIFFIYYWFIPLDYLTYTSFANANVAHALGHPK